MNNFKKFVALGLAASMVFGTGLTAFASAGDEGEDVEATGAGTEAYVDKDVFLITVPTSDALTGTMAYTVDPFGIVAEADSSKVIEEGAKVLFASDKATSGVDYSATSKPLTITNKSSIGVTVDISAEMVEASGTTTYAAGYSTTADFSGTGDDVKGLYIGIIADNEPEKALSTTAVDITQAALSAADEYEVKLDGTTYKYQLKTATADTKYPEYSFKVTGTLNDDVKDSTWYTQSGTDPKVAAVLPTIKVTFTPNGIKECKPATAIIDENTGDVYISKTTEEGGFEKPKAIEVNGKTVATIADPVGGYVVVSFADICKAWGYSDVAAIPEDEVMIIWNAAKTFKVTIGESSNAINYYAEIPAN